MFLGTTNCLEIIVPEDTFREQGKDVSIASEAFS
jgi:hypothetical protein